MTEAFEEVISSLEDRLRKIAVAKEKAKEIREKQKKHYEESKEYQREKLYKG